MVQVIKDSLKLSEGKKRIFLSEIKDDNPLDCLLEKLRIVKVNLNVSFKKIANCYIYAE